MFKGTHDIYLYICIFVTGSVKRYTNAHTMIFLYKRCYKTRNIFYSLKKNFFERPSNWSSAQLKDGYLNLLLHSKNVVKRGWAGRQIRLKKRIECFFQSLT